jgi:hypothetical protein
MSWAGRNMAEYCAIHNCDETECADQHEQPYLCTLWERDTREAYGGDLATTLILADSEKEAVAEATDWFASHGYLVSSSFHVERWVTARLKYCEYCGPNHPAHEGKPCDCELGDGYRLGREYQEALGPCMCKGEE